MPTSQSGVLLIPDQPGYELKDRGVGKHRREIIDRFAGGLGDKLPIPYRGQFGGQIAYPGQAELFRGSQVCLFSIRTCFLGKEV